MPRDRINRLYCVFVLELDGSVGEVIREGRPNMFVGRASTTELDEHVERLVAGEAGPTGLRGHVVKNRPDLYERSLAKPKGEAKATERELACRLIRRWHDVYGRRRWRLYVIELDPSDKHPGCTRPWVYVGLTSKSPEERFDQHRLAARNRRGKLYNPDARDYGVKLWRKYYDHIPPACTLEEGKAAEERLARRLHRDKGFRVEGDGLPPELRGQ